MVRIDTQLPLRLSNREFKNRFKEAVIFDVENWDSRDKANYFAIDNDALMIYTAYQYPKRKIVERWDAGCYPLGGVLKYAVILPGKDK